MEDMCRMIQQNEDFRFRLKAGQGSGSAARDNGKIFDLTFQLRVRRAIELPSHARRCAVTSYALHLINKSEMTAEGRVVCRAGSKRSAWIMRVGRPGGPDYSDLTPAFELAVGKVLPLRGD